MLNIPSGKASNVSFGPARVFMSKIVDGYDADWSTTPMATPNTIASNDVGWIGEDGVTVELSSEKKDITQGNPKLINYSFCQAQGATVKFSSIQWDFDNFSSALGAGATAGTGTAGSTDTFAFGGNALNDVVAMVVQHQMATTGDTLTLFCWKVQSESGFSIPFGADEHSFEFGFKVVRSEYEWGGEALGTDEQLIRFNRWYAP